jgi:hypothetical protein
MVSSEFEPLALAWVPDLRDLKQALRVRRRSSQELRTAAAIVALLLTGLVTAVLTHRDSLVAGITVALVLYAYLLGPGKAVGARAFFRRTAAFRAPVEMRVVPGVGITTTIPGTTSQLDWTRVAGFRETDRVFVLQLDEARGGPFLVLAKRGLADPADVDVLRTVLEHATGAGRPSTHPAAYPAEG